jgi:hypothetical protein
MSCTAVDETLFMSLEVEKEVTRSKVYGGDMAHYFTLSCSKYTRESPTISAIVEATCVIDPQASVVTHAHVDMQ